MAFHTRTEPWGKSLPHLACRQGNAIFLQQLYTEKGKPQTPDPRPESIGGRKAKKIKRIISLPARRAHKFYSRHSRGGNYNYFLY